MKPETRDPKSDMGLSGDWRCMHGTESCSRTAECLLSLLLFAELTRALLCLCVPVCIPACVFVCVYVCGRT